MSRVIRISDESYDRLKKMAQGFETPGQVLRKVLDSDEELFAKYYEKVAKDYDGTNDSTEE